MKLVIGIDEVGRGPIAGPVAVGAFVMKAKVARPKVGGKTLPLRDSKKLTRVQREQWYGIICEWQKVGLCDFVVTMISAKKIDKDGIAPSIRTALEKSLRALGLPAATPILLDGGLKAPKEFPKQKTIVKGDETEPAISLASIVAKVTRDRHMLKMAKKHPAYGFEAHVGYGTAKHYAAIQKHGLIDLHRRSFLRRIS